LSSGRTLILWNGYGTAFWSSQFANPALDKNDRVIFTVGCVPELLKAIVMARDRARRRRTGRVRSPDRDVLENFVGEPGLAIHHRVGQVTVGPEEEDVEPRVVGHRDFGVELEHPHAHQPRLAHPQQLLELRLQDGRAT